MLKPTPYLFFNVISANKNDREQFLCFVFRFVVDEKRFAHVFCCYFGCSDGGRWDPVTYRPNPDLPIEDPVTDRPNADHPNPPGENAVNETDIEMPDAFNQSTSNQQATPLTSPPHCSPGPSGLNSGYRLHIMQKVGTPSVRKDRLGYIFA